MPSFELQEFDEYIAPDGTVYNLNDGLTHFLMSIAGQGMPTIEYRTQRGPFQHGETLLDYFLRPRVIQAVYRRKSCSRDQYWEARSDLLDAIRPNRHALNAFGPGVLRKRLPNGEVRDLEVVIESGPGFEGRRLDGWDEWAYVETLRFVAHDPTFFSPTEESESFILNTSGQLTFPITFPIYFNVSFIGATTPITYPGTWPSFPTITIVGPLSKPRILNLTTGETISMAYDVQPGETVTIDLRYGFKTVTNQLGTNLIGTIDSLTDLATFHIEPDPGAPGGINQIQVQGTGAQPSVTMVTVAFMARYIGI